jgi:hypothetical protein
VANSLPDEAEGAAGDVLAAALGYASQREWPVFPVRDKRPLTQRGFRDATLDPDVIEALWRRWPDAGVALPTGAGTAVVLDVDVPKGGGATLKKLVARYGRLPATLEVMTPSGGVHAYFRHPGGRVPCSVGKLGPGIDVRGDGGYVVAPPSPGPNGRPYKLLHDRELAPLPGWVLEHLEERRSSSSTPDATISAGTRNSTFASMAGAMRRRGFAEDAILAALEVTNRTRCEPPLERDELERIAGSIAGYEPEAAATFALVPESARELCAQPDPPESDRLVGLVVVRRQRTILAAESGAGKTTLAQHLVRAATEGGELLGWEARGGARVLIVDLEQGLKSIKRGLREAGLDRSELVDVVRVPDGLALDSDPAHVAAVEELLAVDEWDVVVLDPLYKAHAGDSNDERQIVDLMRRLDGWREQHGFALILTSHLRKPVAGAKFTLAEVFGSSALTRGAEVVLGLRRLAPGYARLHFLKDRDGDLPVGESWGLLFDRETGYRRDPNDGKKPKAADRIRELLEEDPDLGVEQLATAAKVSDRTVRRVMKELETEKQSELELEEEA